MPSNQTDLKDRRERERMLEANLAADRAGRDRLRARADVEAPHATSTPPVPRTPPAGPARDRR